MLALLAWLLLGSCKKSPSDEEGPVPGTSPKREFQQDRLSEPLGGEGLRLAWRQQTKLHGVFIRKYDLASEKEQEELRNELDAVYFTANPILMQVFEEAIAADPTEPANYVSCGYYLLPRYDKYEESLTYIQKGITMEEDNPAWHFLMAYAYVAPFRSGDFYRFGTADKVRWMRYSDKYNTVIRRAERKWAENWYVPYFRAIQQYRMEKDLEGCWEAIIEGNRRQQGYFVFVPPLPLTISSWKTVPDRDQYFDLQWNFGLYSYSPLQKLVDALIEDETNRGDPERLWEILVFLYQASETRPYDRIFHYHLGRALKALKEYCTSTGDTERTERLAEALKFYDSVSATFKKEFEYSGLPLSSAASPAGQELMVIEQSCRRQEEIIEPILRLDLRLMKLVREALGFSPESHPLVSPQWKQE